MDGVFSRNFWPTGRRWEENLLYQLNRARNALVNKVIFKPTHISSPDKLNKRPRVLDAQLVFPAGITCRSRKHKTDFPTKWSLADNFQKSVPNDPEMTFDMFKVKSPHMHTTYTYMVQFSSVFALRWAAFELQPNLETSAPTDPKMSSWHVQGNKVQKCIPHTPMGSKVSSFLLQGEQFSSYREVYRMTPKWRWHVQGKKCPYAYHIHARGPNFRPYCSTMILVHVIAQFGEKCTEWHQIHFDMFNVKSTHMHITHTREVQIFVRFAPISSFPVMAQFGGKCTELPQNDINMLEVKSIHVHTSYAPVQRPKFLSLSFNDEQFRTTAQIWEMHRMTQTRGQWALLMHHQNPKITLNTRRSKVTHIHVYCYPRLPNFTPLFSMKTCIHLETSAPGDPKLALDTKRSNIPVSNFKNRLNFDPWGRKRVYVQLLALWPMAKFHAQMWQFWNQPVSWKPLPVERK